MDSSNLRPSRAMYIDDGFDSKVNMLDNDQRSKYNHSSTLKSNARFPYLASKNGTGYNPDSATDRFSLDNQSILEGSIAASETLKKALNRLHKSVGRRRNEFRDQT